MFKDCICLGIGFCIGLKFQTYLLGFALGFSVLSLFFRLEFKRIGAAVNALEFILLPSIQITDKYAFSFAGKKEEKRQKKEGTIIKD